MVVRSRAVVDSFPIALDQHWFGSTAGMDFNHNARCHVGATRYDPVGVHSGAMDLVHADAAVPLLIVTIRVNLWAVDKSVV